MSDEIKIDGFFNNAFQNIENSNIEVTQILVKSFEYNDLLDKINTKQELFDLVPETNTERRLQLSGEINQLKKTFEQFKRDVTALAETFNKLEINTDRLRRAKEFFVKGAIGEARAVLETELEQMQNEQTHLLKQKEHYETEVLPNLINNSEEFYLLAMSTQVDYNNPNRFEDTCKYFEDSIKSYPTEDNTFQFARFLKEHNQLTAAEKYYYQYLNDFEASISVVDYATVLNNLANIHKDQNRFDDALKEFEEALAIRRKLAEMNSQVFLPDVAISINNLALLHQEQNRFDAAMKGYRESLTIYRRLEEANPLAYLDEIAGISNNLANLYSDQNCIDEALTVYQESLTIYRKLAESNPVKYMPFVALLLNNLAILHVDQARFEEALQEYHEALKIRVSLAAKNPMTYKIDIAQTNYNLALLYLQDLPDRDKSISYTLTTIAILSEMSEVVIYTKKYLEASIDILKKWNLSDEEISQMIAERVKGNE